MNRPVTTQREPSASAMSVLYLAGEVDDAAALPLHSQLACAVADPPRDVVVDLSRVTFMSLAGLRLLMEAADRLGGRLWLQRISRPVARLLGLTGLRSTFLVIDHPGAADDESVEEAGPGAPFAGMQDAMRGRDEIEQAKGLVMQVHDCDAEHAWNLLLQASRNREMHVSDLAVAVSAATAGAGDDASGSATRAALQELVPATQAVDSTVGRRRCGVQQ